MYKPCYQNIKVTLNKINLLHLLFMVVSFFWVALPAAKSCWISLSSYLWGLAAWGG